MQKNKSNSHQNTNTNSIEYDSNNLSNYHLIKHYHVHQHANTAGQSWTKHLPMRN